jgi:HlyD family secretion protein
MDVLKNNKKNRFLRIFAVSAIGVLLVFIVLKGQGTAAPIIDIKSTKIGSVRKEQFDVDVSAPGYLQTKNTGAVIAKNGGLILKRAISNGDTVKKGDLLFELENPVLSKEYYDAVEQTDSFTSLSESQRLEMVKEHQRLKGDLIRSNLELKNKKLEKNAKEILFKNKNPSVSKMEYEKVLMEYELAFSSFESNKTVISAFEKYIKAKESELINKKIFMDEKLDRLRNAISALKVVAEHDGVVQDVAVDEGDSIRELGLLCRIPSSQEMYVSAKIPAFDIEKIRVGHKATVKIGQIKIDAVVNRIDPLVKDSVVAVDLTLKNYAGEYRVNTPVRVSILAEIRSNALTVERPVNVRENSKSSVYVISGETAGRTEVTFGVGTLNKIEVIAGLEPGQKIVISDIAKFAKDAPIVRIE